MNAYSVRILRAATRELERLDKVLARRITERIRWLAENFDAINPEALTSEWAGLFKLRVGNYRVVYEVFHAERLLIVHMIGHRREIYRNRKRR